MSDARVALAGVTKAFGEVQAVRPTDLEADEGELLALVGPSGCGKTTLLRLIAGFEAPDAGTIHIGGSLVAGDGVFTPPERRRVGMVFQQLALFPHLDVAGNVGYGLKGMSRRQRASRVQELLALVGLKGYEKRFPDELSGGEGQRVALARALAPQPAVVLLDEPFSSLDLSLREAVRREVRRILKVAGATAILVTHDQDEALALGDRVAVMLGGRIAQVGLPEEVYRRPRDPTVADFLGDANLIEGDLADGVLHTEVGQLVPAGAIPTGPRAIALLRPEDLDLELVSDGPATVVGVEYFGHDQVVALRLSSGLELRARLHARERFPEGSRVSVRCAGPRVVAFSLEAG
ncbi:MAG: ABC transporter ATP-binding protein [Actinobacteria bacterium]|nr:ABC transporter ATP-binding protein [Actinomycetota bacterium]